MAKKLADHYKTLGVDKKATTAQIKRAYRKRAERAHPDKGGNTDEMADLNLAWQILGNPARRTLYDQTGSDQAQNSEQEILSVIMEAFQDALMKDASHCLNHARKVIAEKHSAVIQQKKQAEEVKRQLLAKRKKITVSQGDNLWQMMIDSRIANMDGIIAISDHGIEVLEAALKRLEAYESSEIDRDSVVPYMREFTTSTNWS